MAYTIFIAKRMLVRYACIELDSRINELLEWVEVENINAALEALKPLPRAERIVKALAIINKWGEESEYETEEHLPWWY